MNKWMIWGYLDTPIFGVDTHIFSDGLVVKNHHQPTNNCNSVFAGNASGLNDGAALCLLMSAAKAAFRAGWAAGGSRGFDPWMFRDGRK